MEIPRTFKLVFLTVVGLTLVSIAVVVILAMYGSNATTEDQIPQFQRTLMASCTFGWQAGLGAILGLIGGKVTQ